ncbi:polycystin-1-like protein 2 [Pseudophryne corroboree]|uniref:polycystin-1-like protein 2 n=1 Tax=Pseudophryne corroboree TaxID=495146 RepID=UPI0030819F7A
MMNGDMVTVDMLSMKTEKQVHTLSTKNTDRQIILIISTINMEYKKGLRLGLADNCLVFENVTLTITWLLNPYTGNLSCIVSTGDGHSIDPYQPENSIIHSYASPGEFAVFVECSTSEWHVTAQQNIIVEESSGNLSVTGCFSQHALQDGGCGAAYGETLWVQVELSTGNNTSFLLIADNMTLSESRVKSGETSHNLTLDAAAQRLIGPGARKLQIMASNNITGVKLNASVTIQLIEAVSGLQAVMSTGTLEAGKELQINLSLSRGAPAEVKIEITGPNETVTHSRQCATQQLHIYNITIDTEGTYTVKVTAGNAVSNTSLDIGNITVMGNSTQQEETQDKHRTPGNEEEDVIKKQWTMQLKSRSHVSPFSNISLQWPSIPGTTVSWSCGYCWSGWYECVEQNLINTTSDKIVIPAPCLPPPNAAFTIRAAVTHSEQGAVQDEKCFYVTAKNQLRAQISCETNCKNVNLSNDMVFRASCEDCEDVTYSWYLDASLMKKPMSLPAMCHQRDFRLSTLILLQRNTSTLVLNSSFLQNQSDGAFRIKLTAKNSHEYGEEMIVVRTLPPPEVPTCTVDPGEGSALTSFRISCFPPCSLTDSCIHDDRISLTYCFYPKPKSQLYCGPNRELPSVHLQLGEEENDFMLNVTVTVTNNFGDSINTTVKVKVRPDETSIENLASFLSERSANIIKEGSDSNSLMQLYKSVSSVLNQEAPVDNRNVSLQRDKKELREVMLTALSAVNVTSLHTALQMSEVLKDITLRSEELSSSAQVEAMTVLKDVSHSLLTINNEQDQTKETTANYLFNAISNVLEASARNGTDGESRSTVSQHLLSAVENLQSALLVGKVPNNEPTVLMAPTATMYINRLQSDQVEGTSVNIPDISTATFTLPSLSSLNIPLDNEEVLDLRMVSFSVNPFSQSATFDISGSVGGLSLTSLNGSVIPIKNLTEYIEIILPRNSTADGEKSLLSLANFTSLLVNVTSASMPLVIHLELSEDIPLALYLGYEYHPNQTNYDIDVHLSKGQYSGDKGYSWVINPKELFGEGTYYLTVTPEVEGDVLSIKNISIAVTCFASQCVFWDETNQDWNSTGCHIGPKTTPHSIQCLCSHLTFFGSSFIVMPNAIDVSRTVELFATFVDNPVVVTTVGCIAVFYVLVLIWARRKDIQDNAKVKIIALEDNDPFAQYRYLVTVFTGHRRGAATTSKVTLTLYGSDGESDPHHLSDPDGAIFERGGSDVFMMTTLFPLGEVQSIRLWHDNSGARPSWYVNRVLVHDVELDQKWYFLCNSWLSVEVGDCMLDKVFSVATEEDMKQFSNLFFMKTSKGFRDGHIWYSVFSRSPRSPFTRMQRVSCCFSLLLCTMLTSIMFWGVPTDPADQKMDLGKIEFTWQEVMIGFESSLLMFPINLLIVQIFRNIRPKQKKESSEKKERDCTSDTATRSSSSPAVSGLILTPDTILKDIRRIASSLFKAQKAPLPDVHFGKSADINKLLSLVEDIILKQNRAGQEFYDEDKKKERSLTLSLGSVDEEMRSVTPEKALGERPPRGEQNRCLYQQLQHIERKLELLGHHQFQNPRSYSQAVSQVQHMKEILEDQIYASGSASDICSSSASLSEEKKKTKPKGLPWWFVFVGWFLVAATSGVSGFFTMLYGLHYGKDSSIKWLISMAISFFESLFITQPLKVLGFAAFFALVLKKVEPEDEEETALNGDYSAPGDPNPLLECRRDSNIYQPPPPTDVSRMKNNFIKEQKVFALIREILAYLGFLWMLLLVAYGQRDPNSYYLNKHIENSFTDGLGDVCSYRDFFTWANTTLINNLYGTYPGFVTDGHSKLVGGTRIRQVRVIKDSCPIARALQSTIEDCRTPYSLDTEDMGLYGEKWNISAFSNTTEANTAWHYQSQSKLRGHPVWGRRTTYRGGGYVVDLGSDRATASRVLQYLFNNVWLDTYTRAVFVEFTIYNANVNLFCIIRLTFETNALGTFLTHADLQSIRLYPYTDGLHIFVVAAEVIYFLFVIYYMVIQVKLMRSVKCRRYFQSKWNLLEFTIILISWSALSVFVKRTILGNRDINYYQDHKDEFVSFNETADADAALGYLIAFLVLLSTIKLWHLLRLNPKLKMITATLRRAWGDISGFITVMVIMFLAYSIACNLIFGWKLKSYKTVFDSAKTMVSLQLGIFNYEEVLDYNPILGSLLVGSCIIFMTFVVLNLFISVILVAFSEEQKNHQASEEEEIVDLMLMKICSFLALRHKKEDAEGCGKSPDELTK